MKDKSKDTFYSISDTLLKWSLYLWRCLFWLIVGGLFVLMILDQLPNKLTGLLIPAYIMVLIIKVINYITKFAKAMQKDLQIIKKKLGLKARPVELDNRIQYTAKRVKGGISFLELREHYIGRFGLKRWLTDGRESAEYTFKNEKMDKNGNPELREETISEITEDEIKE